MLEPKDRMRYFLLNDSGYNQNHFASIIDYYTYNGTYYYNKAYILMRSCYVYLCDKYNKKCSFDEYAKYVSEMAALTTQYLTTDYHYVNTIQLAYYTNKTKAAELMKFLTFKDKNESVYINNIVGHVAYVKDKEQFMKILQEAY